MIAGIIEDILWRTTDSERNLPFASGGSIKV